MSCYWHWCVILCLCQLKPLGAKELDSIFAEGLGASSSRASGGCGADLMCAEVQCAVGTSPWNVRWFNLGKDRTPGPAWMPEWLAWVLEFCFLEWIPNICMAGTTDKPCKRHCFSGATAVCLPQLLGIAWTGAGNLTCLTVWLVRLFHLLQCQSMPELRSRKTVVLRWRLGSFFPRLTWLFSDRFMCSRLRACIEFAQLPLALHISAAASISRNPLINSSLFFFGYYVCRRSFILSPLWAVLVFCRFPLKSVIDQCNCGGSSNFLTRLQIY